MQEFNDIVKNYPGTDTAANAQYYIGYMYFTAGQYEDAVKAFDVRAGLQRECEDAGRAVLQGVVAAEGRASHAGRGHVQASSCADIRATNTPTRPGKICACWASHPPARSAEERTSCERGRSCDHCCGPRRRLDDAEHVRLRFTFCYSRVHVHETFDCFVWPPAYAASLGVWIAYTQNPTTPPQLKLNKISDSLYEIEGDGGNVAVYLTDEGVIVIDDKFERDYARHPGQGQIAHRRSRSNTC